jgi:hypothetical protein
LAHTSTVVLIHAARSLAVMSFARSRATVRQAKPSRPPQRGPRQQGCSVIDST